MSDGTPRSVRFAESLRDGALAAGAEFVTTCAVVLRRRQVPHRDRRLHRPPRQGARERQLRRVPHRRARGAAEARRLIRRTSPAGTLSPPSPPGGGLASKQDGKWIEANAMTRRLVVLGAGTAGTMIVNKLRRKLPRDEWEITVVDRDDVHPYQPGYLFAARSAATTPRRSWSKPRHDFLPRRRRPRARRGRPGRRRRPDACSSPTGGRLDYDYLVIATGTSPRPDQTPGMLGRRVAAQHLRLLHPRGRRGAGRRHWRSSTAGGSSSTSPRCRSSARWRRWSSPSWPRRGCASAGSATGSSWST